MELVFDMGIEGENSWQKLGQWAERSLYIKVEVCGKLEGLVPHLAARDIAKLQLLNGGSPLWGFRY